MRVRQFVLGLRRTVGARACSFCQSPVSDEMGFVFCPACGGPHYFGNTASPFEILGAPKAFSLDEQALENRYYALSKRMHPDRFAARGAAVLAKSQELSAVLNQAYLMLKDPESRLETLLRGENLLIETRKSESRIPAELAEEYFELQEAAMERSSGVKTLIEGFRKKLERQRQSLTESLHAEAARLQWTAPDRASLDRLVELRERRSYIRSMLENMERFDGGHDGARL